MHILGTCSIIILPIDILVGDCGLALLLKWEGIASAKTNMVGANLSEYQFFLVVYKMIPHIRYFKPEWEKCQQKI